MAGFSSLASGRLSDHLFGLCAAIGGLTAIGKLILGRAGELGTQIGGMTDDGGHRVSELWYSTTCERSVLPLLRCPRRRTLHTGGVQAGHGAVRRCRAFDGH